MALERAPLFGLEKVDSDLFPSFAFANLITPALA